MGLESSAVWLNWLLSSYINTNLHDELDDQVIVKTKDIRNKGPSVK
jgi:hypothetical protein